ncbi:MAG: sulfite exporter TauE/SafE family protein, partial [Aeropyrum sp.]|nr:sulfite exporter TauE/SafE family protein [Aeropyrum sp.]
AAPIMLSMLPGSIVGAYLVAYIDPEVLEVILAAFILYYSGRLFLRTYREFRGLSNDKPAGPEGGRSNNVAMVAAGALAGVFAGLTGTGGGAVIVPILTTLRLASLKEAVATSMVSISLGAVASASVHAATGLIDYRTALPFASGALAGSVVGPMLAKRMSVRALRPVVAVVLSLVALRLLFS